MARLQFFLVAIALAVAISCQKKSVATKNIDASAKNEQATEASFVEATRLYAIENYAQAKSALLKTISINKNVAAAHFLLGKIFIKEKKFSEAILATNQAILIDNKNRHYYYQLAQLYEYQRNYKQAIETYNKLIANVPNTEEYYYELATDYIYAKEYDEAIKIYNKIESIYGKSIDITRQKQQIYLKQNKLESAIAEGNAYIKEFPDEVEMKITQAEILYTNNKPNEAVDYLEKTVKSHPNSGEARILLANIYSVKKDVENSKKQLDYIFESNEIAVDLKILALKEIANDPDESKRATVLKYTDIALKQSPQDAELLEIHGDLLSINKQYKEAHVAYKKAAKINATNYNVWVKLIQLDAELNYIDSMVVHSEEAITYFPNQGVFWMLGGTAYQLKKQPAKAIEWLVEAKKLSATNEIMLLEIYSRLGDCYNEAKQYKKSNEAYDNALKIDKNNVYVLNNYSYYLSIRKENLPLAKQMSELVVKKFPTEANYLDTHAWVLYMMKDYQGAFKILEVAAANSNNGTIIEHFGDVLFQLGKHKEAVEEWKKAKELGDTTDKIEQKINDKKLYEE